MGTKKKVRWLTVNGRLYGNASYVEVNYGIQYSTLIAARRRYNTGKETKYDEIFKSEKKVNGIVYYDVASMKRYLADKEATWGYASETAEWIEQLLDMGATSVSEIGRLSHVARSTVNNIRLGICCDYDTVKKVANACDLVEERSKSAAC